MKSKMHVAMVALTVLFVFGCTKSDKPKTSVSNSMGKEKNVSEQEDDVAAALVRIRSAAVSLTNCLYRESDKAMPVFQQIHKETSVLPPAIGKQCVKEIARSVVDVPYEHLNLQERSRALDRMWDIFGRIGLPSMGKVDFWELIILKLSRIRDTIEYARSEPNNWATRSFIAYESENLEGYSENYERKLAYKSSPQADPCTVHCLLGGMSEDEYAIIKSKFEAFLGRPIRTYEEITRLQRERIKQLELEEERRRGGPDVQVDTGGL